MLIKGLQVFNYRDSDYVKDAGIVVNPHPIELKGKVIAPPPIKYGDDQVMVGHNNKSSCL